MTPVHWFGFPLRSHTAPSLPVVSALVQAGAEVTFHTTSRYHAMVEATGARVATYPSWCDAFECGKPLEQHVCDVSSATAPLVSALAPACGAELVVFDASAAWGREIATRLRVPAAASVTTFVFTRAMLQLISRPSWMSEADIDVLATTGELKLVYTSRAFQPGGEFLDASHLFIARDFAGASPGDGARVIRDSPRPLAYVSLGTIYGGDVGLLRRVSAHLDAAGWQVIVSLGSPDTSVGDGWPSGVRVFPFVDQLSILKEASLVVTHGGLQTVTEALAHGVPMIVLPLDVDQHVVARRAVHAGAAIVLDPKTTTDAELAGAIAHVGAELTRFAESAGRIGRSFADGLPAPAAAHRLLALAEDGGDR
ncbi:MAG: glycosyltransferase [Vicinamibacterales bacterium]